MQIRARSFHHAPVKAVNQRGGFRRYLPDSVDDAPKLAWNITTAFAGGGDRSGWAAATASASLMPVADATSLALCTARSARSSPFARAVVSVCNAALASAESTISTLGDSTAFGAAASAELRCWDGWNVMLPRVGRRGRSPRACPT